MTDADLPPSDDSIANDLDLDTAQQRRGTAVAAGAEAQLAADPVLAVVVVPAGSS